MVIDKKKLQERLRHLNSLYLGIAASREIQKLSNEVKIGIVESEMKRFFPGNYKVEEYFDPSYGSFQLRLRFEDEADKVWFLLQCE